MGSPPPLLLQNHTCQFPGIQLLNHSALVMSTIQVGEHVLTCDMLLRVVWPCDVIPQMLCIVDRDNADEGYSCCPRCLFHRGSEVCDDRPQEYLHQGHFVTQKPSQG